MGERPAGKVVGLPGSTGMLGEDGEEPASVCVNHTGVCSAGDDGRRETREVIKRGMMSKGGSHSVRWWELRMRLAGVLERVGGRRDAWISFPDKVRVPGVTTGRGGWIGLLERSLEVRESR